MDKHSKMKCNHVQEDAVALLGVELTDEEEQAVFAHLSNCPHCREEFRRDRKAWRAISTCPVVTADASFNRMLSLRLSLDEDQPRPDQVDRIVESGEWKAESPDKYDLSRLVSFFTSATPQ